MEAAWFCAGGFPGWLERCPGLAALVCWFAVLLLHLHILQVRSRRLWLSGSHLVYQSLILGFVSDLSIVTGLRGHHSPSGSLRELILVCRDRPLLRLRLGDWDELDLRGLIEALVDAKPSIKLDPLVCACAGLQTERALCTYTSAPVQLPN